MLRRSVGQHWEPEEYDSGMFMVTKYVRSSKCVLLIANSTSQGGAAKEQW